MEEILHQLIGSLSHSLQDFIHLKWLAGFLPSTVVLSGKIYNGSWNELSVLLKSPWVFQCAHTLQWNSHSLLLNPSLSRGKSDGSLFPAGFWIKDTCWWAQGWTRCLKWHEYLDLPKVCFQRVKRTSTKNIFVPLLKMMRNPQVRNLLFHKGIFSGAVRCQVSFFRGGYIWVFPKIVVDPHNGWWK